MRRGHRVKAALVGAGQIAVEHLKALQGMPTVEIAGVCDLSRAAAESAALRHGATAWFTDLTEMLRAAKPDVVHVTTSPQSHYSIAVECLEAGAHVIVEKPITSSLAELEDLLERAATRDLVVLEDYNTIYSIAAQEILRRIKTGVFGAVVHVEVMYCLDILGPGGFADPNAPHPVLTMPGGAIADFLPHLASLAHAFVGPHRAATSIWQKRRDSLAPFDEFRGLVEGERATAALTFSCSAQPAAFWLRVYGERMRATANLFETRLTFTRVREGLGPLGGIVNGLDEGKAIRRAAVQTFLSKFRSGQGGYDGLTEIVRRTYGSIADGTPLPITPQQVREVNLMIDALRPREVAP